MKKLFAFSFGMSILALYVSCQKIQEDDSVLSPPKYVIDDSKPVWADEFNYTGAPDPTKWGYDIGGHGWGNQEKQYYTNDLKNSRVENGVLIIEARKEKMENNDYTSARLVTKNKADFLYGRFEFKAKLPKGRGTWPAGWMLATEKSYGANYWPDNGEIDIIEHVGFDQDRIHGNIHTKAFNHTIKTNKGNNVVVPGISDSFHIYACEWTPDAISIEIDGNKYFTFPKQSSYGWAEWPFDKKFHMILNIAIGGGWGGQKGIDDSIFPQRMEVDYVRVYQAVKK